MSLILYYNMTLLNELQSMSHVKLSNELQSYLIISTNKLKASLVSELQSILVNTVYQMDINLHTSISQVSMLIRTVHLIQLE
jgi:hypothetical protein